MRVRLSGPDAGVVASPTGAEGAEEVGGASEADWLEGEACVAFVATAAEELEDGVEAEDGAFATPAVGEVEEAEESAAVCGIEEDEVFSPPA